MKSWYINLTVNSAEDLNRNLGIHVLEIWKHTT